MKHQKTIKKIIAVMLVSLFVIPGLMLCVSAEAEYDFDKIIEENLEDINELRKSIEDLNNKGFLGLDAHPWVDALFEKGTTQERMYEIVKSVYEYMYPDEEAEDFDTCLNCEEPNSDRRIGYWRTRSVGFAAEYDDWAVAIVLLDSYPEVTGAFPPILLMPEDSITGDVNADGEIDGTDYLMLKRYVLGTYELADENEQCADVNADGGIDTTDYLMLKRYVLGTYVLGEVS